ncbi:Hadh protein [Ramicandelaber brevisporus]|nr:Hadh protein [Ramicandelaber brevisporus]
MFRSAVTATAARSAGLASRALSTSATSYGPIKKIAVYGSGLMGSGIVQVAAQNNFSVTMVDVNDQVLAKGQGYIASSLKRVAKKQFPEDAEKQAAFIKDVQSRIKVSTDSKAAASDADLVVEAIVENIELKRQLFKTLDESAPKHAIFASNTSSLPIKDIAEAVSARQSRFAGLHFFNPVPQMKLVEVVRTSEVETGVLEDLVQFCKELKKSPVLCADTPGFIVNRLLVPYMMEALRIVERGEATAQDVDTAMKLGSGYPMGPFELADYVGLDTIKFITDGWYKSGKGGLKGNQLVGPVKILDDLVAKGHFGRKTGKGFYDYTTPQAKN